MREVDPSCEKVAVPRHATLAEGLEVEPDLADHFVFGFVRNPWARMHSWYAMIERRRERANAGDEFVRARLAGNAFWQAVIDGYPDFESFVLQGTDEIERLGRPQLDYLRHGSRYADFIGRLEHFETDLRTAFRQAGIPDPPALEHRNAGPSGDYRDRYTPIMRDKIGEVFAADVEHFGYAF